jgi:hypothetical protein
MCRRDTPDSEDTLVFVDIDGVLNVSIRDNGGPVELTTQNLKTLDALASQYRRADGTWHCPNRAMQTVAERLESVSTRSLSPSEGKGETYKKYLAHEPFLFSDRLAKHLASVVRAAGTSSKFVLSSMWRWPEHGNKVHDLERAVSRHLGEVFEFGARTTICKEYAVPDRLRLIGDFVERHCDNRLPGERMTELRVLVLDDFGASAFDDWNLEGDIVSCTADAEKYLQRRCGTDVAASVRVIHTYAHWTTQSGLLVHIGSGLVQEHLANACSFLSGNESCRDCSIPFGAPFALQKARIGDTEQAQSDGHPDDTMSTRTTISYSCSSFDTLRSETVQSDIAEVTCWSGVVRIRSLLRKVFGK